ncbi:MAG: hypothetical protein RLZZ254_297 [Actinomycetota bacterium]|jgi:predicted nucleic acid-binding protein
MRCYLDSSALAKLVIREPESHDLRVFLKSAGLMVTSAISETELRRAALRVSKSAVDAAPRVLSVVAQMEVSREILSAAARVQPAQLRTLDAIHLATALELLPEIDTFVTYDNKLADAADSAGMKVAQPGI